MKNCMYNQSDLPKVIQDGLFDFVAEKENLDKNLGQPWGFIIDKNIESVPYVYFIMDKGEKDWREKYPIADPNSPKGAYSYPISEIRSYSKDARDLESFDTDINFAYKNQCLYAFCQRLEDFRKDDPEQILDKLHSMIGDKFIPKDILDSRCFVNFDDASIVRLIGRDYEKGTVFSVKGYRFNNETQMTEKHTFSLLAERLKEKSSGGMDLFKLHIPKSIEIFYEANGDLDKYWLSSEDKNYCANFDLTNTPLYDTLSYVHGKNGEDIYKEMLSPDELKDYETHGTLY